MCDRLNSLVCDLPFSAFCMKKEQLAFKFWKCTL